MTNPETKNYVIAIDKDILKQYKLYCNDNGYVMKRRIELLMLEEMKKNKKQ